jgi:hypothetical protein
MGLPHPMMEQIMDPIDVQAEHAHPHGNGLNDGD